MPTKILIITEAEDFHAMAVEEALLRKGAEVTSWATSDFPSRAVETVHFAADGARELRLRGEGFDLDNPKFDVVWRRRPSFVVDRKVLHPADQAFAESECSMFRRSLLRLISPNAFWINSLDGAALASSKLLQQEAARKLGFNLPETLFTNDPEEVRRFIRRGRDVVYKPLFGGGWANQENRFLTYTALVSEDCLVSDEVLRQTPGIFQECIAKEYELRVTVMGRHVLAAKVLSQETEKGKLDWRRSYDELKFEPTSLSADLEAQCLALLDSLGLVFGCFDFIVTPEGEHVFLEVNEMGQFLFVERYCGLPLLDAFSELLVQGRVDFDWSHSKVQLRYDDPGFEKSAVERLDNFRSIHCPVPESLAAEEEQQRPGAAPPSSAPLQR